MDLNIEYKNQNGEFPKFLDGISSKKVSVIYDVNTKPYAEEIIESVKKAADSVVEIGFDDRDLIPDERVCDRTQNESRGVDYILAVGSGSLNDVAKSQSYKLGIKCGVLATAASMDGYCSRGAALMQKGVKVTENAHSPSDILIDADIIRKAPKIMTAAGFGDILGKYTALTDWKTANAVKGEEINVKAFEMMKRSLDDCMAGYEDLTRYMPQAVSALMESLIVAGLAMAECGNSRPASGSEHHISHFLEMDFIRRGERVPLHGVKVGLGTMVSVEIYNYIKDNKIPFYNCEKVYGFASELPKVEEIGKKLKKMGCPTRFSEIGVRKETMEQAIEKAYTVRDRFTVLTLAHELGITEKIKPIIMQKYY
ncbi:MAG: sn-glycerol-1-phosphate dehydrogenase [Clostridia bacterium]|nr:sn-glycerol-1-phosphate dehydrogenase [Clostridia bacterium]